jgi:hypothetical protein
MMEADEKVVGADASGHRRRSIPSPIGVSHQQNGSPIRATMLFEAFKDTATLQ